MNMKGQIRESKNRKQMKDRTELKAFGMLHKYANPDLIPLEQLEAISLFGLTDKKMTNFGMIAIIELAKALSNNSNKAYNSDHSPLLNCIEFLQSFIHIFCHLFNYWYGHRISKQLILLCYTNIFWK